jgi:hypothetical protein
MQRDGIKALCAKKNCPCCGQPLPGEVILTPEVVLTPTQRRIFRAIRDSGVVGIQKNILAKTIYGRKPTESDIKSIKVLISSINQKLAEIGKTVYPERQGWHQPYVYRDLKTTTDAA